MRSRARRIQMSKHKLRSICIYHLKSEIIVCRAVRPRGRGTLRFKRTADPTPLRWARDHFCHVNTSSKSNTHRGTFEIQLKIQF